MKSYQERLVKSFKTTKDSIVEAAKVLSSMAFVFVVLVLLGPLSHAVQHIERLF